MSRDLAFPPPAEAEPEGLLAVGGDLEPERLILAYSLGIFPWYEQGLPILWHSPDPRMVLVPAEIHVPRRLARRMRRAPFRLSLDEAFSEVIRECASIPRRGQNGTWITAAMIDAYERLHEQGFAHSAEAWEGGVLVGGVYGVSLGRCFFGESMFTRRSDASKIALVTLVQQLERWGFTLFDCQVRTEHLARLGAREWPRARFLTALEAGLNHDTRQGRWRFDADLAPGGRS